MLQPGFVSMLNLFVSHHITNSFTQREILETVVHELGCAAVRVV